MEPEITDIRAEREWLYIIEQVGKENALAIIPTLKGKQKAFPLNIARKLKIKLPEEQYLPQTNEMKKVCRKATENGLSNICKLYNYSSNYSRPIDVTTVKNTKKHLNNFKVENNLDSYSPVNSITNDYFKLINPLRNILSLTEEQVSSISEYLTLKSDEIKLILK